MGYSGISFRGKKGGVMKEYFNVPPFKMKLDTKMEKYRYETWDTKEPETISWINSFLELGCTFFDIGANIGIYSLYCASKHKQSLTYAFEPFYGNASRLMQNIELNKFDNIIVIPFGVFNIDKIDVFGLVSREIGHSGSQVSIHGLQDNLSPVVTIDSFCHLFQDYPTHIKIDIDGQELQVIEGALKTIYDDECQSVLVEINKDGDKIRSLFKAMGYTADNRFNKMKNHSRVRREKEGIHCENVVFTR